MLKPIPFNEAEAERIRYLLEDRMTVLHARYCAATTTVEQAEVYAEEIVIRSALFKVKEA